MSDKISLHGFNNITKTLCFNLYFFCYAEKKNDWIEYVNGSCNSSLISGTLSESAHLIGAEIVNISTTDYEPAGSSAAILVSEPDPGHKKTLHPADSFAHLDKSHISAHTYPESHPSNGMHTLRIDIEISTCGNISPLKTIKFLMNRFSHDIVVVDYIIRGFTRDSFGKHLFRDHEIYRVTDFIDAGILKNYEYRNFNLSSHNIFHTKMKKKNTKPLMLGKIEKNDKNSVTELMEEEKRSIFVSVR